MAQQIDLIDLCPDTLPPGAREFSQVWNQHLVLKKGEQVLVTAPSGKGKSTFISLLYGLRRDFTGQYKIDGTDTRYFSPARWSDARAIEISIVFQDLRLFMDYTAMENLALKGQLEGSVFDENTIRTMAEILGVESLLDKKCNQLSYGERQRMAIIRSLLQQADFLIMDEPFSHLDDSNADKALDLIQKEASKNGSALIITSLGSDYGWNYDRLVLL
jgi:ABC-type lipoprotein export system ATPase subunit